jgi:hypothetical protein
LLNRRGDLGFEPHALGQARLMHRRVREQEFDRDASVESAVLSEPNATGAPVPDLTIEPVSAPDDVSVVHAADKF